MGTLAGSGWQYQGFWGSFAGTPIAHHFFITARHVGGAVGDKFIFQGRAFTAAEAFDDPNSDLRIWRICETFPSFAPLHEETNELGKAVIVFGRGTQRGDPVFAGDDLRGWKWGGSDGRLRWGENRISQITDVGEFDPNSPLAGLQNLLKATFDADGGPNEAHLSAGDSGGALFINDETGGWKLAGINFAADAVYNTSTNGPGFVAALFDGRGFYTGEEKDWSLMADNGGPRPGAFYATRISTSLAWIKEVLASNRVNGPVLQSAASAAGSFEDDKAAILRFESNLVVVPKPSVTRFYQLRGCVPHRIQSVSIEGDTLLIRYRLEQVPAGL